jgi:hypothetical protein
MIINIFAVARLATSLDSFRSHVLQRMRELWDRETMASTSDSEFWQVHIQALREAAVAAGRSMTSGGLPLYTLSAEIARRRAITVEDARAMLRRAASFPTSGFVLRVHGSKFAFVPLRCATVALHVHMRAMRYLADHEGAASAPVAECRPDHVSFAPSAALAKLWQYRQIQRLGGRPRHFFPLWQPENRARLSDPWYVMSQLPGLEAADPRHSPFYEDYVAEFGPIADPPYATQFAPNDSPRNPSVPVAHSPADSRDSLGESSAGGTAAHDEESDAGNDDGGVSEGGADASSAASTLSTETAGSSATTSATCTDDFDDESTDDDGDMTSTHVSALCAASRNDAAHHANSTVGLQLLCRIQRERLELASALAASLPTAPACDTDAFASDYLRTRHLAAVDSERALGIFRNESADRHALVEEQGLTRAAIETVRAIQHFYEPGRIAAVTLWELRFPRRLIMEVLHHFNTYFTVPEMEIVLEDVIERDMPRLNDYPADVRAHVLLVHGREPSPRLLLDILAEDHRRLHPQDPPPPRGAALSAKTKFALFPNPNYLPRARSGCAASSWSTMLASALRTATSSDATRRQITRRTEGGRGQHDS